MQLTLDEETYDVPDFVLVTGNRSKKLETERILGAPVPTVDVDLPEIQSADLHEVLRAKGEEAYRRLSRPLVVEETGLDLDALNGFPGPLVKWMLEAVGSEGVANTAIRVAPAGAAARCALLFVDGSTTVLGEGVTRGSLVLPPRGDQGFGWDPVFQPDGSSLTYAELGVEEKDRHGHRGRAWRDFAPRLAEANL